MRRPGSDFYEVEIKTNCSSEFQFGIFGINSIISVNYGSLDETLFVFVPLGSYGSHHVLMGQIVLMGPKVFMVSYVFFLITPDP